MSIHGGDILSASERSGLPPGEIVDFSVNINPLGPPAAVVDALHADVRELERYPDPAYRALRGALAEAHGIASDDVMVGNGATELIYLAARALAPRRAAVFAPCYSDYWRASANAGAEVSGYPGSPDEDFAPNPDALRTAAQQCELVWIGHPNNPSGWLLERDVIRRATEESPRTAFVIDEAFIEFHERIADFTLLGADRPRNVIVIRSLTKFFAMPGLRLGFAVVDAGLRRLMADYQEPWTVNAVAARAGEHLYDDADYLRRSREVVTEERRFLLAGLKALDGLQVFESHAPFLLLRIGVPGLASAALKERLLSHGILIRDASNYRGLDATYVRVAVKARGDNERLLEALGWTLT